MTRVPTSAASGAVRRRRVPLQGRHGAADRARTARASCSCTPRVSATHVYRVTRVIGGRYREDFAGVEVAGEPRARRDGERASDELDPARSRTCSRRELPLKGYSVMVPRAAGAATRAACGTRPASSATTRCRTSTIVLGALYGPARPAIRARWSTRCCRRDAVATSSSRDDATALRDALDAEVARPSAAAPARGDADRARRRAARDARLRERFGGAALRRGRHRLRGLPRRQPRARARIRACCPTFAPRSAVPRGRARRATRRAPTRAECDQPHLRALPPGAVLALPVHLGGRPARQRRARAAAHINSGEARDFLLGGCARRWRARPATIRTARTPRRRSTRSATPAGNAICVRCHAQYATPAALAAHATTIRPAPARRCIACHMPQKNMGLDYALTRYHRIGSPDRSGARRARPAARVRALPRRQDASASSVDTMERWWGKRYDRAALAALYGESRARTSARARRSRAARRTSRRSRSRRSARRRRATPRRWSPRSS